jgi:hypothetical protein
MTTFKSNSNKTIENNTDKQHTYAKLLQQFPKIKFSYELKSYKKVSNSNSNSNINIQGNGHGHDKNNNDDVFFMIPKGKKYFIWFKNSECLFLELDNDKQVVNVTSKKTSRIFPNDTILYGTHFYYRAPANSNSVVNVQYYFTIENIHYYNGVNLDATQTVFEKCKTLHLAFTTATLEKTFQVDVGLPHIDTCLERISAVKQFYQVYCIQKKKSSDTNNQYQNIHFDMLPLPTPTIQKIQKMDAQQPHTITQTITQANAVSKHNTTTIETSKKYIEKSNDYNNMNHTNHNNKKYKIFIVSADIQNDIYNLIDPDAANDDLSNYDYDISNKLIASIPDYKTSVFMNALFRNIKENKSLDALEESDDEDEFENTNIDKFVDLTKKIKMKCVFNYKFKKWTPIECVK